MLNKYETICLTGDFNSRVNCVNIYKLYLRGSVFRVNIYYTLCHEPLQKTLCESMLFIFSPYCTLCSLMRTKLSCLVLTIINFIERKSEMVFIPSARSRHRVRSLVWRSLHCFRMRRARCSSVVRAFAHGAMVRRIDSSRWTHRAMSGCSQCSTTGATNAVVCAILSVGWCI